MGIQSTRTITRQAALARIHKVDELSFQRDFKGLYEIISEDESVEWFIKDWEPPTYPYDNYTNDMLEDIMDFPFYRYSMFENYTIVEGK